MGQWLFFLGLFIFLALSIFLVALGLNAAVQAFQIVGSIIMLIGLIAWGWDIRTKKIV